MKKLFLAFFAISTIVCHATTVTGTIKFEGSPLNGAVSIQLVYPGTTGAALNLNGGAHPVKHPVKNGAFTALTLDGNDALMPRGTYYLVTYYDAYNMPILRAPYFISGATYDLGTALPTPITTANVNFLDLLGLRNMSVQNLTVSNSMQFSTGTIVGTTGISNAQFINSIVFAQYFQGTSTTCGLQEAYNALPAYGGWIIASPGACTMLSTFNISKPVLVTGYGSGGINDLVNGTTYVAGTELINGSTSQSSIAVNLPASSTLGGVIIRDLALIGNKTVSGSTTGAGITVNGGAATSTDLHDISLSNLFVYGFKGDGIDVIDKVSRLRLNNVQSMYNTGAGIAVSQTQSAVGAVDLSIDSSTISNNTNHNIWFMPTSNQAGTARITNSTIALSPAAGIFVDIASTARIDAFRDSIHSNATFELFLGGGFGHSIEKVTSIPQQPSQEGLYLIPNTPTPAGALSASIKDNDFENHGVCDYFTNTNSNNVLFYSQLKAPGSAGVIGCLNGTMNYPVLSLVNQLLPTIGKDYYLLNQATCTLANSTDSACTGTIIIPTQPDIAYEAFIQTANSAGGGSYIIGTITTKSTSSFGYTISCTFNCSPVGTVTMDVHIHHP